MNTHQTSETTMAPAASGVEMPEADGDTAGGDQPGSRASIPLAFRPEEVAKARRWAASTLRDWSLGHATADTQLIVSELVTNAIRYAGTSQPVRVALYRDHERLYIEVHDGSPVLPFARRPMGSDEGGRGLYHVSCLAEEWGAEATAAGKRTWAALPLP